jgi:Thioredoxin.
VDVDECEDIASDYEITAMPTFVFIKNKKKVSEYFTFISCPFTFRHLYYQVAYT